MAGIDGISKKEQTHTENQNQKTLLVGCQK